MAAGGGGGKRVPFRNKETEPGTTNGPGMVKSPPVAAFIMTHPEFLFEFLVVALDHPAVLADSDQPFQREFHWQARQPVAAWLPCAGGPLDQQPLLWL